MLFLGVFGMRVEDRLGPMRYVLLYLVSGYAATALEGGVTLALMSDERANIPGIGASGAISGVLGAYLVLFPANRVLVLLLRFPVWVPAIVAIGMWAALQVIANNLRKDGRTATWLMTTIQRLQPRDYGNLSLYHFAQLLASYEHQSGSQA